jgi:hypothetical protein
MSVQKVSDQMLAGFPFGDGITKSANDPAINTNPSGGVGTLWLNITTGELFALTDATAGQNVWTNVGSGSGDVVPNELPANPTNAAGFPSGPVHNSTQTYTFSGGTDTDGTVTHYAVDQISVASAVFNVQTAEVAAGQAHTFILGTVGADTPVTFRVRSKDNLGGYSAGTTVSTTMIPWEGIVGSGGVESTDGDYKIHTFVTSGTFSVSNVGSSGTDVEAEYLVIGGGGGGDHGGGGAGGYLLSYNSENSGANSSPLSKLTLAAQDYTVTVGAGGAGITSSGSDTIFAGMTAVGGGRGGNRTGSPNGHSGGSGGGGGVNNGGGTGQPGSGTANQGMAGGSGHHAYANYEASGGGGGAGQIGSNNSGNTGGKGGDGMTSNITGAPVQRAGGGGGGNIGGIAAGYGGVAGAGGGGIGAGRSQSFYPGEGVAATGGGGGGGRHQGAAGGSGVVIVRYKYQ